jgi:hypothetical protein
VAEVDRKLSSEAVDNPEADSAWLGVAIDQGTRDEVDVGSTERTGEVVECASGLGDRQEVDHTHMEGGCRTDQVGAAHACSRESSSVLE